MRAHEMMISRTVRDLDLPLRAVYLLARPSTPAETRDAILERAAFMATGNRGRRLLLRSSLTLVCRSVSNGRKCCFPGKQHFQFLQANLSLIVIVI